MKIRTEVLTKLPAQKEFKVGDLVQFNDNENLVGMITEVGLKNDSIFIISLTMNEDSYDVGDQIGWESKSDWRVFEGTLTIKCW